MPEGQPVSPETRARVLELFEAGTGRNAIAREVGLSGATITTIARSVGHVFERKDSELAVRLRTIDLAVMRGELAQAAMLKAWDALEAMDAPALTVQFEAGHQLTTRDPDGKEFAEWQPGAWREHVLDAPTFSDQRNLATVFGIMVSKATELTKATAAQGSEESVSFIDDLADSLKEAARRLRSDPSTDPTIEPEKQSREELIADLEAQESAESATDDATD